MLKTALIMLLEELKGIDPELFDEKNILTIKGIKYIYLS